MKTYIYHFNGTLTGGAPNNTVDLDSLPPIATRKLKVVKTNHCVSNIATGLFYNLSFVTPWQFWISSSNANFFKINRFENEQGAIGTINPNIFRILASESQNYFEFENFEIINGFRFRLTWEKGLFPDDLAYRTTVIFEIEEKIYFL